MTTLPDHDPSVILLDVETTGVDKDRAEVIELCIQFGFEDAPAHVWRFKPAGGVPAETTAIHGITAEMLADAPSFREMASEIREILDAAQVVVGYNVGFDIDMLDVEFRRLNEPRPQGPSPLGIAPVDWTTKHVVDAFQLWRAMEPRTLIAAVRRFAGYEHEGAHSAEADVRATGDAFLGMLEAFGLVDKGWEEIVLAADPTRPFWLGPSRHLQWKNGTPILTFGKHVGKPLREVELSYLIWVASKDFPRHVQAICRGTVNARRAEVKAPDAWSAFEAELRASYPPPESGE